MGKRGAFVCLACADSLEEDAEAVVMVYPHSQVDGARQEVKPLMTELKNVTPLLSKVKR